MKMFKKLSIILMAIFVLALLPCKAKAATDTKEAKISSELKNWIVDEATNTICGLTKTQKSVLFINGETLKEEETILLGLEAVDMVKSDNLLYISLKNTKKIIVIDINKREIVRTIRPKREANSMIIIGQKLYYSSSWRLYSFDLTEETEEEITDVLTNVKFAYNEKEQVLYIGENGSSGCKLTYYSLKEEKVISKTNYNNGYGFSYVRGGIFFDGANVYYAGREFDSLDATRFTGDYEIGSEILHVTDELVFTTKAVYNKETHAQLGTYKEAVTLSWTNGTLLYQYSAQNGKIKRVDNQGEKITDQNVIDILKGKKNASIQKTTESKKVVSGFSTLEMNSSLDEWMLVEDKNVLLACSKKDRALFFINAGTLNLESSILFKSAPTDMILDEGLLYVALADAHQILVIDVEKQAIKEILYTTSDPYTMVIEGQTIYYAEMDQHCYLYKYDLKTKSDQVLNIIGRVYEPSLAINEEDHILYIGESASTGCDLIYYSTQQEKIIGVSDYNDDYGFYSPERTIEFDGEFVYYANRMFDKYDPTDILMEFDVWEEEEEDGVILYEFSSDGKMYAYIEEENMIVCMDLNRIAFVDFDAKNGTELETQIAEINGLLSAPTSVPKRTGYTFAGWYRDEQCKQPWNFDFDLVQEDMLLYAKWIINPARVQGGLAKQASYNKVELKWNEVAGANGYEIYRSSGANKAYELLGTTSALTYTDQNVEVNKTYSYKVRAYQEDGGVRAYGEFSTVFTGKVTLPAPGNLKAKATSFDQIQLSWNKTAGVTGYEIYQSTVLSGSYSCIGRTNNQTYLVKQLKEKTTYYYKVRAYIDVNGKRVYGAATNVINATTMVKPLATVSSLKVISPVSYNSMKITWGTVSGATGYEVYEASTSNGTYKLVATTKSTSYTKKGIQTGTKRYYKVRAYRMNGTKKQYGSYSKVVSGTVKLPIPTKLKVVKSNATTTKLTWNKVSGASGYEIYRSTSKKGTYKKVATVNTSFYKNSRLKKKQTYYYKVRAYRIVNGKKIYSGYTTIVSRKL
ncbi:MAG: InlB B-repeat-containing protein [bacterium]|nr:InlB B-repeat-containing protein [bacterium]